MSDAQPVKCFGADALARQHAENDRLFRVIELRELIIAQLRGEIRILREDIERYKGLRP